ncbi:DUF1990 family protein [Actinoplanes ianthinogenes]|uniref:DUF1990 family protein n=1 Tax=Actinoplanes ianthinogenes TaxID=122358 RepID=UPI001BB31BB6|nr:DUF1990 domain-containing protein [Actinoplanes ianthinogenes]
MGELNYDAVGGTRPADARWSVHPSGYRSFEETVCVGRGVERWEAVAAAVLRWRVKILSGFRVSPAGGDSAVRSANEYQLTVRVGPVRIREPVRVIAVVDQPTRRGFSYGTLVGHPVSGEEAFIASRSSDGKVWLTIRSLTRPASGGWRWAFPLLLVAQRFYRRRYLRSLTRMS